MISDDRNDYLASKAAKNCSSPKRLRRGNDIPNDSHHDMKFTRLLLLLILPLYVLDQVTKWWIVFHFAPPWSEDAHIHPVIEGFFNLVRVQRSEDILACVLELAHECLPKQLSVG